MNKKLAIFALAAFVLAGGAEAGPMREKTATQRKKKNAQSQKPWAGFRKNNKGAIDALRKRRAGKKKLAKQGAAERKRIRTEQYAEAVEKNALKKPKRVPSQASDNGSFPLAQEMKWKKGAAKQQAKKEKRDQIREEQKAIFKQELRTTDKEERADFIAAQQHELDYWNSQKAAKEQAKQQSGVTQYSLPQSIVSRIRNLPSSKNRIQESKDLIAYLNAMVFNGTPYDSNQLAQDITIMFQPDLAKAMHQISSIFLGNDEMTPLLQMMQLVKGAHSNGINGGFFFPALTAEDLNGAKDRYQLLATLFDNFYWGPFADALEKLGTSNKQPQQMLELVQ